MRRRGTPRVESFSLSALTRNASVPLADTSAAESCPPTVVVRARAASGRRGCACGWGLSRVALMSDSCNHRTGEQAGHPAVPRTHVARVGGPEGARWVGHGRVSTFPGDGHVQEVHREGDKRQPRVAPVEPRRGEKGLLITTGSFTRDAQSEASRDGAPPVELIDGERLCDLLKEYGLGVAVTQRIEEDISVQSAFFNDFS